MPGRLQVTLLRKRTFHFQWLNETEVDYVCVRCGAISVDGVTCLHCERERVKKRESLARFLASKQRERESS